MTKERKTTFFDREVVHTLAQDGTDLHYSTPKKGFVIVSGKGSDINDLHTIRNRAKRKLVSQFIALELLKIAESKKNKVLIKQFRNTYYCLEKVHSANGKLYGKFCKNRVCTVCLAIRKSELINKYKDEIDQWPEPQLLTLTVKSVNAKMLRATIKNIKMAITKIIRTHQKRYYRSKGNKLRGIYSIESNFNPKLKTYNPHFHIITDTYETANILLTEWLKRSKPGKTNRKGQHIGKISNRQRALIEVIKYGTKIFTENDLEKRIKEKSKRSIYIKALYTIVEAFNNIRVFEHFGFLMEKRVKETSPTLILTDFDIFTYCPSKKDWISERNEDQLSGYIPTDDLIEILEQRINTELS